MAEILQRLPRYPRRVIPPVPAPPIGANAAATAGGRTRRCVEPAPGGCADSREPRPHRIGPRQRRPPPTRASYANAAARGHPAGCRPPLGRQPVTPCARQVVCTSSRSCDSAGDIAAPAGRHGGPSAVREIPEASSSSYLVRHDSQRIVARMGNGNLEGFDLRQIPHQFHERFLRGRMLDA